MNLTEDSVQNVAYDDLPYLLFAVGENVYGVSVKFVQSIETFGNFTPVIGSDPSILGVILYQNEFISLMNLRNRFGLASQIEEFEKTVNPSQRKEEHEYWMKTLKQCIIEHKAFTLADDPHDCTLGQWYYHFDTNNMNLKYEVDRIRTPHEAVHTTAKEIKRLMESNKYELAMEKWQELYNTHYSSVMRILSNLTETVENNLKEIVLVLQSGSNLIGVLVDFVVDIDFLDNVTTIEHCSDHFQYIGRRRKDGSIAIILEDSIID